MKSSVSEAEKKSQDNLLFSMLIGEPYLYGNPGNITVMVQLCNEKFDLSMYLCEELFKIAHPEEERNFKSWLWIIYSDKCGKDIEKTMEYLRILCNHPKNDKITINE